VLHDARQQIGTDPTHTATASGHSPNNRTFTCRPDHAISKDLISDWWKRPNSRKRV
jgi:hypothetical protein